MTRAADLEVRHGYTIGDLDSVAAIAVAADRLMAMDWSERRNIAWSAIAEHLCAAKAPPRRQELIRVGWQAIYRHVRDGLRQRGYADGNRDYGRGPTMPRFTQYWEYTRVTPSHEDSIVDRIAAAQVMATITGRNRDAVIALAVHGDYQRAADSLGINYRALVARLGAARQQWMRRWHEEETPRRSPRRPAERGAIDVRGAV